MQSQMIGSEVHLSRKEEKVEVVVAMSFGRYRNMYKKYRPNDTERVGAGPSLLLLWFVRVCCRYCW